MSKPLDDKLLYELHGLLEQNYKSYTLHKNELKYCSFYKLLFIWYELNALNNKCLTFYYDYKPPEYIIDMCKYGFTRYNHYYTGYPLRKDPYFKLESTFKNMDSLNLLLHFEKEAEINAALENDDLFSTLVNFFDNFMLLSKFCVALINILKDTAHEYATAVWALAMQDPYYSDETIVGVNIKNFGFIPVYSAVYSEHVYLTDRPATILDLSEDIANTDTLDDMCKFVDDNKDIVERFKFRLLYG